MSYELKEAVVSFDGFKSFLTASIDNNMDLEALESGLKHFESISNSTKVLNYLKNDYYPNKIGNEKIGDDTIVLNVNNPFRCVSSAKGHCKCDGFCYAKRICNQYKNSGLYTLCQEIQFEKLTISQIKASIELNLTKEVKFARWNEQGDFKNLKCFNKANEIAKWLLEEKNIISYAYTANKDLPTDILEDSYIIVNYSYKTDFKNTIVVDKESVPLFIDKKGYTVCNGNCKGCSYCKDKNNKNTVVFVKHGSNGGVKKQLEEVLTEKQLLKLEAIKNIDYGNFLLSLI